MGHDDAFPRPRLNVPCPFSRGTLAGTRGYDEVAPRAATPKGQISGPLVRPVTARSTTVMARTGPISETWSRFPD